MICFANRPTVEELLVEYYEPLRLVGKSPRTAESYKTAVSKWKSYRAKMTVEKIDTAAMAGFQSHLLKKCATASVNNYCRHIMVLLRFAADEDMGLLDRPPKWRKLREPKRSPLALTVEEFATVLKTAQEWPRDIVGCPARDWWTALLLTCWETGLRHTALLSLRSIDFLLDSGGLFCQADDQKDKEAMWFDLPDYVLDAITKIYDPQRELLFPRTVTIETVGKWFRVILDQSGIYAPKGCGLRFHRLRKSKASYTEANGGDAQRALGHSARSVTERYLDPRIVGTSKQPFMPSPFSPSASKPKLRLYG